MARKNAIEVPVYITQCLKNQDSSVDFTFEDSQIPYARYLMHHPILNTARFVTPVILVDLIL